MTVTHTTVSTHVYNWCIHVYNTVSTQKWASHTNQQIQHTQNHLTFAQWKNRSCNMPVAPVLQGQRPPPRCGQNTGVADGDEQRTMQCECKGSHCNGVTVCVNRKLQFPIFSLTCLPLSKRLFQLVRSHILRISRHFAFCVNLFQLLSFDSVKLRQKMRIFAGKSRIAGYIFPFPVDRL